MTRFHLEAFPFGISRLAPNGRKAPSIYRNKAVLARRRTASEGRPYGDFVSRVVYSEAPEPKRHRITPEEHRVI